MDLEALAEADRRGILPPEMKPVFDEAVKRGLVPGPSAGVGQIDFSQDNKAVRKQIAALPKEQRKAAAKEWAQHRVAKERKAGEGSTLQTLADASRNFVRGMPFGSYVDEGLAGLRAGSFSGDEYEEQAALERARMKAVDADSTKLGRLPVIGDVTVGGLTKLAGAVASMPFSPVLRAAQGAGFLPQAAAAATTGALYGGAYGFGEGDNVEQRGVNAAIGGGAGAGVGVAGAGLASTLGPAVQGIRNRFGGGAIPPELQGTHPQAVRRVAEAVRQDGLSPRRLRAAGVPNEQGTITSLGDRGMIADLGQNTSSLAGGIAKRQGTGADIVASAVRTRRRGARGVIDDATTRTLGAPVNEVTARNAARNATRGNARPYYDQFYNGPPVQINQDLARAVEGAATTPAVQRTLNQMVRRNRPVDLNTGQNVNEFLDRLRRNISSMARAAGRQGDDTLASEYGDIARTINREVDRSLNPANPGQSTYAQARARAGEGLQYDEGLQLGQTAIAKNTSANQLRADIEGSSPAGALGIREGMRRNLRDIMETTTTRFGASPTAGIRQMIGPQARQKIAIAAPAGRTQTGMLRTSPVVTGQAQAPPGTSLTPNPRIEAPTMAPSQLARTVDQEAWFNRLYEKAIQNSQANANANAQRLLPPQPGEVTASSLRGMSIPGALVEGAAKLFNLVRGGHLDQRNDRVVADMARMLVAQGADRRQIVEGLLRFGNYRGISAAQRQALERVVQSITQPTQMTASRVATDQE